MTSIGLVGLAPQIAAVAEPEALGPAISAPAALAGTVRDAQIADLPSTSSSVNLLQSLASASTSSASAQQVSAIPAPTLPTTQQLTQAQQAAAQPPLKGDFYADGDDA